MVEIVQILKELGTGTLDLFWWPVAIWTVFTLLAATAFKFFSKLSAIYQYHLRVALLAALPAGILASPLIKTFLQLTADVSSVAIFVIQNPLPITVSPASQTGINWSDPALWLGIAAVIILVIAVIGIIKLLYNFIQLYTFASSLDLNNKGKIGADHFKTHKNVTISFSDRIEIPCTFGWFKKHIVLPANLQKEPEKYNMALRHELMHIRNHDYLLNNILQSIKALFWFHPLVHYFNKQAMEYREIYCDQSVLTDSSISQKNYAQLLLELAPKPLFKSKAAVNMAVNPSTLKKRIQVMKKQTNITPSLKQSIVATLLFGLTLTGFMACSDVTSDGLTTKEVKEFQRKAADTNTLNIEGQPLYVLNGEILDPEKRDIILSRLKPKYIKSITVLKDEAAIEAYGEAGKNGVIEIELLAKEKALNDLLPPPPPSPNASNTPTAPNYTPPSSHQNPPPPPIPVYIKAEDMPTLKTSRMELMKKVEYPKSCREKGIKGTVIVQFIVTKTGELTNFEVLKGIGGGCDEAALQAIKQYAKFTPGTQDGKPVNVRMNFPVIFRMQ